MNENLKIIKSALLREFQRAFPYCCLLQGTKLYRYKKFQLFNGIVLYPEEGSIAETSVETLLTASIL